MNRKRASTAVLATMASMFLMASAAMGADARPARESVARVSPDVGGRTEARRAATFRTERTDSWLCNYVSPLFCSNLVPTIEVQPAAPSTTPQRGRK